ncbi:MAG: TPM domain-containing protein [Gammaproteobacteria bacterium]|jgi:putative membrane protein|nr:TPM domain-containing protein [Gammaproteobacteria bacterium]
MPFMTTADKQRISDAIAAIERQTSGELVTVITRSSDDYRYIPYLWAALLALLLPGILSLDPALVPAKLHYLLQICIFLGASVLFKWPPLKIRLIPPGIKKLRAHRLALEQFFVQNLHSTPGRTGILLFVSVAEHYVEIIADKGINDVVSEHDWKDIVEQFVVQVKDKRVVDGFLTAIFACGTLLAAHFPATAENTNELPNHLVEL